VRNSLQIFLCKTYVFNWHEIATLQKESIQTVWSVSLLWDVCDYETIFLQGGGWVQNKKQSRYLCCIWKSKIILTFLTGDSLQSSTLRELFTEGRALHVLVQSHLRTGYLVSVWLGFFYQISLRRGRVGVSIPLSNPTFKVFDIPLLQSLHCIISVRKFYESL